MEFSCCAFYEHCQMGKNECFFMETDPFKIERCRCYKRHHTMRQESEIEELQNSNKNTCAKSEELVELEQLSLF